MIEKIKMTKYNGFTIKEVFRIAQHVKDSLGKRPAQNGLIDMFLRLRDETSYIRNARDDLVVCNKALDECEGDVGHLELMVAMCRHDLKYNINMFENSVNNMVNNSLFLATAKDLGHNKQ